MVTSDVILSFAGPIALALGGCAALVAILALVLMKRSNGSASKARPAPSQQLLTVSETSFVRQHLLSPAEQDWLAVIDAVCDTIDAKFRVLFHLPLPAVIAPGSPSSGATDAIRNKRLDFLIVDETSTPSLAVMLSPPAESTLERTRTMVVETALRQAGIPMVNILPDDELEDVGAQLYALLITNDAPVEAA